MQHLVKTNHDNFPFDLMLIANDTGDSKRFGAIDATAAL